MTVSTTKPALSDAPDGGVDSAPNVCVFQEI